MMRGPVGHAAGESLHLALFVDRQIEVLANLYVGQSLQDYVVFAGLVVKTKDDLIGLKNIEQSFKEYITNQSGLFTIPGASEALLFTHSGVGEIKPDYPDLVLQLAALFPSEQVSKSPYVSPDIYKEYYGPMIGHSGFMCALTMVQPESRGAVYLNEKDPNGPPSINPNIFRTNPDLNRLVKGL
ncbi:uncharacterized protein LOC142591314 [Dermacentor variabilis]|uniref:uncharacterized protein LOC142591314 n=1 Tax=Dermacentor variabilis TaxID=34621 RepID=UPI003F5B6739